jgi:hypothetical protein
MTFVDCSYPLEAYARALENAGLLIEALREPTHARDNLRRRRIPIFLLLRALKP